MKPPHRGATSTLRERVRVPPPHDFVQLPNNCHSSSWQSTGQHCVLHVCVAVCGGHACPPHALLRVTVRARCCTPPPHCAVQTPQSPHSETVQSTGQQCSLHTADSAKAGHEFPPCCGCRATARARCCVPPPQVAEQGCQLPQSLTAQCTGHGFVLHMAWSTREGHDVPPQLEPCTIVRVRMRCPASHVCEQACQSPQLVTEQSTEQQCSLQARY